MGEIEGELVRFLCFRHKSPSLPHLPLVSDGVGMQSNFLSPDLALELRRWKLAATKASGDRYVYICVSRLAWDFCPYRRKDLKRCINEKGGNNPSPDGLPSSISFCSFFSQTSLLNFFPMSSPPAHSQVTQEEELGGQLG